LSDAHSPGEMFLMVRGAKGGVIKGETGTITGSALNGVRLAVADGDFDYRLE